jgi:hypothetical protein
MRAIVTVLAFAAVAACLWSGWRIGTTPVRYEVIEATADGSGTNRHFEERRFSDVSALGVAPLVVPVLISGLGAWAAARRRGRALASCALALAVYAAVSGFSIGPAYWPAAGLLVAASVILFFRGPAPPALADPPAREADGAV